jgi:hypothetical protein
MTTYKVTLTKEERDQLVEMTRTGTHAARKIIHALILLNVDRGPHTDENQINEDICKVLKIGMRTIDRVKKRFVEEGGYSVLIDPSYTLQIDPPKLTALFSTFLIP